VSSRGSSTRRSSATRRVRKDADNFSATLEIIHAKRAAFSIKRSAIFRNESACFELTRQLGTIQKRRAQKNPAGPPGPSGVLFDQTSREPKPGIAVDGAADDLSSERICSRAAAHDYSGRTIQTRRPRKYAAARGKAFSPPPGSPNESHPASPRLSKRPTFPELRLSFFQSRHTVRERHGTGGGHRPEPAQIVGTATGRVNAANRSSAVVHGVVRPVLFQSRSRDQSDAG
jgi:hypothetical protein